MNYAALSKTTAAKAAKSTTDAKANEAKAIGLEFLNTLEVAEEIEVTLPFPVTLTWDNVTKDGNVIGVKNIRFFTSKLANASFEVSPIIEPGFVPDGYRGETGELVVSCAKQDSMLSVDVMDNGFRKVSFLARPRFVGFCGRKAVKFADSEKARVNLIDVVKAVEPAK